ncbi:Mediator of RNA polymerase II transcription subunit 31 [Echinococcus granulosus]|nr:Mediator of RNA polymerase II transcription subunit 31 [Echinococcus granulosus]
MCNCVFILISQSSETFRALIKSKPLSTLLSGKFPLLCFILIDILCSRYHMQNRPKSILNPARLGNSGGIRNPWVRFQIELEFVQSLGNPDYLTFLAQQGSFDKPEFINYLSYLQYWKSPSYSRFITYPFCLHMLDLLQSPDFRREVAHESVTRFIDDQMLLHWKNYLPKRAEMVNRHVQNLDAMPTPGAGPSS